MSTINDSNKIKLRLHYWDCRGRAQALRYILEDLVSTNKDIDYKEDFELIETIFDSWSQRKADQTVSGPFRTLPVLHWNDTHIFGQTLTIAHVLGKKFDLYGKPTSSNNDPILLESLINGVVNCAYTDVIQNAAQCIFSNTNIEDKNSLEYYPIMRVQDGLESLNILLKKSSTTFFYDQTQPTIADYFAFEAYSMVYDIHPKMLPNDCQALIKLQETMKQRPALENYFKNNRLIKRFTASPSEDDYLAKLSEIK